LERSVERPSPGYLGFSLFQTLFTPTCVYHRGAKSITPIHALCYDSIVIVGQVRRICPFLSLLPAMDKTL
jgi:hypothetical protein